MTRPTLDELGRKFGVDKSSQGAEPWMFSMGYLDTYEELWAARLRDEPITLLELGWGEWDPERRDHANPDNGGRSARMWREYFPKASIHVIDIEKKNNPLRDVHLYRGSQTDTQFLGGVHDQAGDFDVIIDDASHVSSSTIRSFEILWPWLKPGGYYCVEDLFSSYHEFYYGEDEANEDPDAHGKYPTAMQYLKRLADDANYRGRRSHGPWRDEDGEYGWDGYPKCYWRGYAVDWVHFCHSLCVVRKAGG